MVKSMISEKLKLDETDKQIITLLQENPNLTHSHIAEIVNLSQPTVGNRIKKLKKEGILQIQPGVNLKKVELYLAKVEMKTSIPSDIIDMARFCPFMLNAFRLIGEHDILILLVSSKIKNLYNVVDYHFRNNSDVKTVSMEIVIEIAKDLILPVDLIFDELNPTPEKGCGIKCTYKKEKLKEI